MAERGGCSNTTRWTFPMTNFAIGVDLGGTNLRIAAVDETGHLIAKVTLGTRASLNWHRRARHHRSAKRYAPRIAESFGVGRLSRARRNRASHQHDGYPGK